MTPKEKAKELFDKFCFAIKTENDEFGYWTNIIQAKQCALIAVEEIIEAITFNMYDEEAFNEENKFWHSVEEEIENL